MLSRSYLRWVGTALLAVGILIPEGTRADEHQTVSWFRGANFGLRVGAGFHENTSNTMDFTPGLSIGPDVEVYILNAKSHRFGFSTDYLFQTYGVRKGTEAVEVTTRYSRLDLAITWQWQIRAFLLGTRQGMGMSIISTNYFFSYGDGPTQYKNVGVEIGPLLGAGLGLEFGQYFFHLANRMELMVQGDWFRTGRADNITIFAVFAISTSMNRKN